MVLLSDQSIINGPTMEKIKMGISVITYSHFILSYFKEIFQKQAYIQ